MSFLSTLLEDISQSCQLQRGSSVGLRNRYLFDSAYEQVGCQEVTSRSLSTKKGAKKQSAETMETRMKACFKILHVLNKKFRTTKYFVFVKFEEIKSMRYGVAKEVKEFESNNGEQVEKVAERGDKEHKSVDMRTNIIKPNKIKQIISAIYQKYYAVSLKQEVFKKLGANSSHKKNLLDKIQAMGQILQGRLRQNNLLFFNRIKQMNKKIDEIELFCSLINSTLRKVDFNCKYQFFSRMRQYNQFIKSRSNKQQQINPSINQKVINQPASPLTPTSIITTNNLNQFNIQQYFSSNSNIKSFTSYLPNKQTLYNNFIPSQPFIFESLSSTPPISYQLQQKSFSFRTKPSQHLPIQLNKLYKDNIVSELHDIGQNKLFSANQFLSSPQTSFVTATPSTKTFVTVKGLEIDESKYWGKNQDLFLSKNQLFEKLDKEKIKQQKAFFMNQFDRRPASTYGGGSNRKLTLTYNPESSSESLYSNSEIMKIAEQHSGKDKNVTPKTSMPSSPYLNYLDSDGFKHRSSLKSTTEVKKIAQIPKFRLPGEKSRCLN